MKKLLAILLTLIFAFSCFGTLGTTAIAEEASTYNAIVEKGFKGWTTTAAEVNGNADCVEFNTEEGTASLKAGAGSKNTYIKSPTIQIVPDREYELSLYVRSENASTFTGGNAVASPLIGLFVPYSDDAVSVVPGNSNFYAYTSGGVANRTGFKGTWQVEGYAEATIENFSFVSYSGGAGFQKILGGGNFQDGFGADWKKITFKFKGIASATNSGPQYAQVCIGFDFNFNSLKDFKVDVKDVELKEFCKASNVLFESNLNEDGNLVAFDGYKVNQDTEYVTFATEENQYIELKSHKNAEGKNVSTVVATAPFNVFPGNEYEISYDLCIPADSGTYKYSDQFSFAPEWWIYEVDEAEMQDYKVGNRSSLGNAYANKNKDTMRRSNFVVNYSYTLEDGESIVQKSRTGYSFMNYDEANNAFGKGVNVTDIFGGKWVKVTLKFTGVASDANAGAELCAVSFGHSTDAYLDTYFQIKNVQVKETAFVKTTPVYDEANGYQRSVEDFEYAGTQLSDVAKFYGGTYMTEVSWAKKGSEIVTENDKSFLKAYAHSNSILLPLNKGALSKYRDLKVSFDWMFKDTDGVTFEVKSIQLVVYKNGVFNYEGTDYPCVTDVNALAQVAPGEFTFGNWNKATLNLTLNENTMAHENYAILIRYKATKPETVTDFTAENASMYIDNIVVEDGGALLAGDYDNDGKASLQDLAKLAQHFAGWSSAKLYVDSTLADYSGDGKANLYDLVKFAQDLANP